MHVARDMYKTHEPRQAAPRPSIRPRSFGFEPSLPGASIAPGGSLVARRTSANGDRPAAGGCREGSQNAMGASRFLAMSGVYGARPARGTADYLLYVDGKAAGVSRRRRRRTLTGVEVQSGQVRPGPARRACRLAPAAAVPLPVHRRRDPLHQRPRSRAAGAQRLRLPPARTRCLAGSRTSADADGRGAGSGAVRDRHGVEPPTFLAACVLPER